MIQTLYKTNDGKIFKSKQKAEYHEIAAVKQYISLNGYGQFTSSPGSTMVVYAKTDEGIRNFYNDCAEEDVYSCGLENATEAGVYVWSNIESRFFQIDEDAYRPLIMTLDAAGTDFDPAWFDDYFGRKAGPQ